MMEGSLKLCFAASSGGHFEQLMMLQSIMNKYDSFVVTESTAYSIKAEIRVYELYQVNRREVSSLLKFVVNSAKSFLICMKEKPDITVCTGALATIPICFLTKLFGGKLIFIESFAKTRSPTLTGKLLYRFADRFYVQWESMLKVYPKAVYVGGIY